MLVAKESGIHRIPANQLLPEHNGCIITRGLQEWACLLPQSLPFATAERLLGWRCAEERLLSDTTMRHLVSVHGRFIREAELSQARAILSGTQTSAEPLLAVHEPARRPAAWPVEMNQAVQAALDAGSLRAPEGVSGPDWERVLNACELGRQAEPLRHLGPEPAQGQVVACIDEVCVRKPTCHKFWQMRTACIRTATGKRYVSGTGEDFIVVLSAFLLLCTRSGRSLVVLADGARWIRLWFAQVQARLGDAILLQDWFHLCKKSRELASMFATSRKDKTQVLKALYARLWRGDVDAAVLVLEQYRPSARNLDLLDELVRSLRERRGSIPNYGARRANRQYIGSGLVENANNILIATRQKSHGKHWSLDTSDGLTALATLLNNGGWELYWSQGKVLPLAAE